MKLVIASDHAGLELKRELLELLAERKVQVDDLGAFTNASVDYPTFAKELSREVGSGKAQLGVLICGTGIGMSIVANKHKNVRAAVCHTEFEARMARAHNDANVLCLGQRVTGPGLARNILQAFLDQPFEGGRHLKRVQMIHELEEER